MADKSRGQNLKSVFSIPVGSRQGSVLVMVLWILMIISFLTSEYVAHNRNKAGLAVNAMDGLRKKAAAESVLALIEADQFAFLQQKKNTYESDFFDTEDKENLMGNMGWTGFNIGGVRLFVKMEKESGRININNGDENTVRTTIQTLYGEDYESDADELTDALLDWIDPDDLVRLHGAETSYYNENEPFYDPGNGPFKTMAEIFLVKGMRPSFFWGHPEASLYESSEEVMNTRFMEDDRENKSQDRKGFALISETAEKADSFHNRFTIYAENDKRVSVLFPENNSRYDYHVFFIEQEKDALRLAEHLSRVILPVQNKDLD
ncbi:MAG: type II secretion system protein GspK [Desulfobacteraceae bacterium]